MKSPLELKVLGSILSISSISVFAEKLCLLRFGDEFENESSKFNFLPAEYLLLEDTGSN